MGYEKEALKHSAPHQKWSFQVEEHWLQHGKQL
jgi:hypothetical protein